MKRIERFKQATDAKLYAYCLMGNHVHLLLELPLEHLSSFMKRLAVSYSSYFNRKYARSGYLFQERFKSEPVQSDEYFLALLRYIHNNPVKGGIDSRRWTSYPEYGKGRLPLLVDSDFALSMFGKDKDLASEHLLRFIDMPSDEDEALSLIDRPKPPADSEAIWIIKGIAQLSNCTDLASKEREEQDRIIPLLRKEGLSIRQISRLTGINRGLVYQAGRSG